MAFVPRTRGAVAPVHQEKRQWAEENQKEWKGAQNMGAVLLPQEEQGDGKKDAESYPERKSRIVVHFHSPCCLEAGPPGIRDRSSAWWTVARCLQPLRAQGHLAISPRPQSPSGRGHGLGHLLIEAVQH